jgi:gamma-glutamyl hercynylcysteine S-oxide synthase
MPTLAPVLDRKQLVAWYQRNRNRSKALFDLVADEAYYSRPIAQRHPLVFYEGHLPAFSFNTLVRRGLGEHDIDQPLQQLFARGIDPSESDSGATAEVRWPDRSTVRRFADEADRRVLAALAHADLDKPGHPLLDRAEAAFAILEHEAMHQETLLYMWHRLPFEQKRKPASYEPRDDGAPPRQEWIDVAGGPAVLGVDRAATAFGWDNEHPRHVVDVEPFSIERHNVTNAAFAAFIDAGGYSDPRWWRPEDYAWIQAQGMTHPPFWTRNDGRFLWQGMFESVPLPASWPVYVSHAEASAYARWRGARLPSEAEFQRAAFATPDGDLRRHPWGDEPPDATRGVFDFASWDPQPAGSHPAGQSAWQIHDLVGNGWEWTGTTFAPFPGFAPMPSYPEYSADFFDGEHFVMKGASPATAAELLRPSFRNWFRGRYPHVYATFRCVRAAR